MNPPIAFDELVKTLNKAKFGHFTNHRHEVLSIDDLPAYINFLIPAYQCILRLQKKDDGDFLSISTVTYFEIIIPLYS